MLNATPTALLPPRTVSLTLLSPATEPEAAAPLIHPLGEKQTERARYAAATAEDPAAALRAPAMAEDPAAALLRSALAARQRSRHRVRKRAEAARQRRQRPAPPMLPSLAALERARSVSSLPQFTYGAGTSPAYRDSLLQFTSDAAASEALAQLPAAELEAAEAALRAESDRAEATRRQRRTLAASASAPQLPTRRPPPSTFRLATPLGHGAEDGADADALFSARSDTDRMLATWHDGALAPFESFQPEQPSVRQELPPLAAGPAASQEVGPAVAAAVSASLAPLLRRVDSLAQRLEAAPPPPTEVEPPPPDDTPLLSPETAPPEAGAPPAPSAAPLLPVMALSQKLRDDPNLAYDEDGEPSATGAELAAMAEAIDAKIESALKAAAAAPRPLTPDDDAADAAAAHAGSAAEARRLRADSRANREREREARARARQMTEDALKGHTAALKRPRWRILHEDGRAPASEAEVLKVSSGAAGRAVARRRRRRRAQIPPRPTPPRPTTR